MHIDCADGTLRAVRAMPRLSEAGGRWRRGLGWPPQPSPGLTWGRRTHGVFHRSIRTMMIAVATHAVGRGPRGLHACLLVAMAPAGSA